MSCFSLKYFNSGASTYSHCHFNFLPTMTTFSIDPIFCMCPPPPCPYSNSARHSASQRPARTLTLPATGLLSATVTNLQSKLEQQLATSALLREDLALARRTAGRHPSPAPPARTPDTLVGGGWSGWLGGGWVWSRCLEM